MTKFKINKRIKVAIVILLIVVFGARIHLLHKKHVEYKRIKKPTQSKKVKIYKKFTINKKKEITFSEYDLSEYHNPLLRLKHKQDYEVQESIKLHNKEYLEKQAELQRQEELRKQEEEKQRQEQIRKQQELEKSQKNKQVNNTEINRGGDNNTQGQPVKLRISYYTNSDIECGNSLGITASSKHIQSGMIAAPSNIPFGTAIIIDGSKYVVEDRGGAIGYEGDTMMIDVYVPNATQSQLNRLGVKYITGYIIK